MPEKHNFPCERTRETINISVISDVLSHLLPCRDIRVSGENKVIDASIWISRTPYQYRGNGAARQRAPSERAPADAAPALPGVVKMAFCEYNEPVSTTGFQTAYAVLELEK